MTRKFAKYIFLIMLGSGMLFPPAESFAFFFKVDAVKTPSKLSNYVGQLKGNCEKAMEWVSNSKAAQLIGDGIKETKKGIAFAQESYASAMAVYGDVVEQIDTVKGSDEYKAAVISQKIAKASRELKKIQEEKLSRQEELQQEMELLKTQSNAKIANINSNLDVLQQSGQDESSLGNIGSQLQDIQRQMEEQLRSLEDQYNQIEEEYAAKIKDKTKEIADLTKELANVANVKLVSEDAAASIQQMQADLFTVEGNEASLDSRREKTKNRNEAFSEAINEVVYKAASGALAYTGALEEVEAKKGTAATMPGESETAGVETEVILKQAELLQKYLELVLIDLKYQTTKELAAITQNAIDIRKIGGQFNFCDYALKTPKKSLLDQAKSAYSKASGAVSDAKDKVSDARQKYEDAKQKYEDVKELTSQAGAVIDSAKDVAKSKVNNESAALTGMF